MATIDEIIDEMQTLRKKAKDYDKLATEVKLLRSKASSYDNLILDLITILDECHYNVDKNRLLSQIDVENITRSSELPQMKKETVAKRLDEVRNPSKKNYALWKCKECHIFNVRASKRIKVSSNGKFTFTDVVQSPCPCCGCRQRLSPKNTRLYTNKNEAQMHRITLQKLGAIDWLDFDFLRETDATG